MPKLDPAFIEALLHEEEGVTLDFKQAQYPFVHASDDDKSELLKDILAFANAWRRTDAFILIGVEEVKGGRGHVLGITEHLDDAALQQFVNTKTQRPVSFAYTRLHFEKHDLAIIQIPRQERPVYLKQPYGRLKASTVYIRRGSSTDIASPDEIAKMGAPIAAELRVPRLEVLFADPSVRQPLENTVVTCLALKTPDPNSLPDYESRSHLPFPFGNDPFNRSNRHYYRELTNFTKVHRLVSPLYLAVANRGDATAHDVRVELRLPGSDCGVMVLDELTYPEVPESVYPYIHTPALPSVGPGPEVTAQELGDLWLIEARTDKVQPKSTHWFQDAFFIGATHSQTIELDVIVFADNLQQPHTQTLSVQCVTSERTIDLQGILELETERYVASPEYRRLHSKAPDVDED